MKLIKPCNSIVFKFKLKRPNKEIWAIAVGADLINLQGDDVNSGLNFGAPALSLSRYLTSGLSIGVRYG